MRRRTYVLDLEKKLKVEAPEMSQGSPRSESIQPRSGPPTLPVDAYRFGRSLVHRPTPPGVISRAPGLEGVREGPEPHGDGRRHGALHVRVPWPMMTLALT